MNVRLILALFCVWLAAPAVRGKVPFEQPDCRTNTKMNDFYRILKYPKKDEDGRLPTSWICEQTYKNKLKACVGIYRLMVNRRFDTHYEIRNEKDKPLVDVECKKREVKYYLIADEHHRSNSSSGEDEKPKVETIQVDMFRCPISKLDIKFKFSWKIFPPKKYDFYVAQGYAPETITILNDSPHKSNICVTNMFKPKSKS